MKELAKEFFELFSGSDIAHGTFEMNGVSRADGKKQGQVKILREPPTVDLWETHLKGGTGVGIIPIKSDNTCRWGAIDIDSYTVDHKDLSQKISKLKIPAVVGRSKSGGAHIWVFLKEPVEAVSVQRKMTELASSLGYADSEIFPKQATILVERGDTGNMLNMPYHSGKRTTRYAFDDKGDALSVEEFIQYVKPLVLTKNKFNKTDFDFGSDKSILEEGYIKKNIFISVKTNLSNLFVTKSFVKLVSMVLVRQAQVMS
jgi:hypothetical protein